MSRGFELRTMGQATLVVSHDDVPLLATDPWLVGSAYARSWWLDEYPSDNDVALVGASRYIYITHGHPDHLHIPSLKRLSHARTLHPDLPDYTGVQVLSSMGIPATVLAPARWYEITPQCRIVSLPVPADDSVLIIDTPHTTIVNLNDCLVSSSLLATIRKRYLDDSKAVLLLKSHSPASEGVSMYRGGIHVPLHDAEDYAHIAEKMAVALGATAFVSFASQAFFARSDSRWANDYRAFWDDLAAHWQHADIDLYPPHVTVDLQTLAYSSTYRRRHFTLDTAQARDVETREHDEATFTLPDDFGARLEQYLSEIWFLRLVLRNGIGWKLRTSGREFFYDARTRCVSNAIPDRADATVTVPDQILDEALRNGTLGDLGITMTIRTDSRVDVRRSCMFFALAAARDAGHFKSRATFLRYGWFHARMVAPSAFWFWWRKRAALAYEPLPRTNIDESAASLD